MNTTKKKTLEITEKYGNDLQAILEAEGIGVIETPPTGRLIEIYLGDYYLKRYYFRK